VTEQPAGPVRRRAVRAILIDDHDRLVLIKRTKPGLAPYWTAPGGGVENTDASAEAALYRELAEEPNAEATIASQVFQLSSPSEAGVDVQQFELSIMPMEQLKDRRRLIAELAQSWPNRPRQSKRVYRGKAAGRRP
jgi:ADP-ribose pyrophosphatase YjhB (NUDIX family)